MDPCPFCDKGIKLDSGPGMSSGQKTRSFRAHLDDEHTDKTLKEARAEIRKKNKSEVWRRGFALNMSLTKHQQSKQAEAHSLRTFVLPYRKKVKGDSRIWVWQRKWACSACYRSNHIFGDKRCTFGYPCEKAWSKREENGGLRKIERSKQDLEIAKQEKDTDTVRLLESAIVILEGHFSSTQKVTKETTKRPEHASHDIHMFELPTWQKVSQYWNWSSWWMCGSCKRTSRRINSKLCIFRHHCKTPWNTRERNGARNNLGRVKALLIKAKLQKRSKAIELLTPAIQKLSEAVEHGWAQPVALKGQKRRLP